MKHRQPAPTRKSPYITATGYRSLQQESRNLWDRRREVTKALAAAAAEGDRSENAEYIYRKKELREIDRRIRYLQKRLPELKVVETRPSDEQRVFFGARVVLEDADGKALALRIVGADEFDLKKNWISVDSPMARALLKRTIDDEILVTTPDGNARYLLCAIEYGTV